MYYLIRKVKTTSQFPYMYCTDDKWSYWHDTVKQALAASISIPLSGISSVESMLYAHKFILICKSETPISLQNNPELLI